jgi:cell division protein FtsN
MPTDFDDSQTSSTRSVSDPMAEHKQRARWRLIGALAFSLASAALAMVVLRDTPRPLSQDFILQMPPKPTAVAVAPVSPVTPVAPAPKAEPKPEPKPESKQESKAEVKPEPKPKPQAAPKVEPKPDAKSEPKAEPKPAPKADSKSAASGYFVQVGAHKTRAAAESIQKRLQSGGHSVTVTVATTSSGTWYRVRVGPFDAAGANDFADRARQQKYQVAVIPPPKGDGR